MKIAFTADAHLTTRADHPERFAAFEDIYRQCQEAGVRLLVVAGDLFDRSQPNYAEFEDLHRQHRYEGLSVVIIPGNHDQHLDQSLLAGKGIKAVSAPSLQPLNSELQLLMLPYQDQVSMGEAIAPFADQLQGRRWILSGHGDWIPGSSQTGTYEPGIYMPLSRADLQLFHPEKIFLGHIHAASLEHPVYYPGSPCPLDISETGLRYMLLLDSSTGEVTRTPVRSQLIYFQEELMMLPVKNDLELLKNEILRRIKAWSLPAGWEKFVQLRVTVSGCALSPRQAVLDAVLDSFSGFSFYRNQIPVLDRLYNSQDPDRQEVATLFKRWLDEQEWPAKPGYPDPDQMLAVGLGIIYQENQ